MKKKLLVTGGTGLVGSYLMDALLDTDVYEIFILGRSKSERWNNGEVTFIETNFKEDWDESLLPDELFAIIHLSQAENFRDFPGKAKEVFYINTLSTLKLINYAVEKKVSHFIYASSGGIYGNANEAINEDTKITYTKKTGFYIATKHCSEVILENYFEQLSVFILRFFFVYGKGQRSEMLIPRLINSVKNNNAINLQGNEGIKINPIYAKDAAFAIMAALKLQKSDTINIAGPEVLSLKEIGELIGEAVGKKPGFNTDENVTTNNLIGDISKMKEILYTPQTKFKEVIKTLV